MTVNPSTRLRAYVTAGLVGLGAGLAAGSPAPVILGTVFLVLAVVGIVGGQALGVNASVLEWPRSMIEGEDHQLRLRFETEGRAGRTYVSLNLSRGIEVTKADGARLIGNDRLMIPTVSGRVDVVLTIEANVWGRQSVGPITTHTESPLGMFDVRLRSGGTRTWVVVPEEVALHRLLAPLETNLHSGDLVSRHRGPGLEFADLRSYRPGDDPRNINWRVSSRSETLWVNERHPERNGDVILLVDAQLEHGTELAVLVDRAVRLSAALLQGHARRRHRLGVITLDGMCRWIGPGVGEIHRRKLLDQLLGVVPGRVIWPAVERAVIRAAKRPAMVIALTPLLDPSMAGLLNTLRRSGVDVSVIEIDVSSELPEPDRDDRGIGRRIWAMERDRIRDRLSASGIPTAIWQGTESPDVPLYKLDLWRLSWRRQLG